MGGILKGLSMKTINKTGHKYTIFNDLHIGVSRKSGVTQQSQEGLRSCVLDQTKSLLNLAYGGNVILLGDIFNSFEIPARDWIDAYLLLADWCETNKTSTLIVVAGNHDISPRALKVSAFETLGTVLVKQFENVKVIGIDETLTVDGYIHLVAHHRNQELFDLTLAKVLEDCERGDYVLLHANYDNKFAEQADHSLNVSEAQALEFTKKGVTLIHAHEHQSRVEIPHGTPADGGSVVCLGNQIPTSVADCLGNNSKFYWSLDGNGLQKFECWKVGGDNGYQAIDWRDINQGATGAKFIRIVGDAVNAEAAQVIDAIHRFRQKSNAFVITNAVKIEGIADIESLPDTFEAAKKFDVMEFVYGQLNEAEAEVIRKIIGNME